jgi:uncharacterized protein Yka (UPF0111/DUF47 family)
VTRGAGKDSSSGDAVAFRLRSREARFGGQFVLIAERLVEEAQLLAETLGCDTRERRRLAAAVQDVDRAVGAATHGVLRALAAAFVTPIDRVDVYRLVWELRNCSRRMEAVVDLITVFELGSLPSGMTDQVGHVVRAADLTREVMPRLGQTRVMSEAWTELTLVRTQARQVHHGLLVELTAVPGDPCQCTRLLAVGSGLDEVVAAFEGVAHVLEQIVVKES